MVLTTENILLIGSLLLLISILAGKTSYRFGVPTLLLFLAIGMLAGSEGLGGIHFDDPVLAQFIGIVSLNFILFSGGLDTSWKAVRPVLGEGIALSTLGVLLTALSLGTFVWWITDWGLFESLLLGAIVSSTDAAAVFSILRSRNLTLRTNLRPTLELESGSNDPMAYVLTIAFLTLVLHPDQSAWSMVPFFLQQMVVGALAGFAFGIVSRYVINGIRLDFEGLYPVLAIALMFTAFSATDFLGGNGFLAVYISGIYLGNHSLIHKKTIMQVFDGLAWLMQIVLFLTLGLLVFPSHVFPVIGLGLIISLFLIFVARPVGVLLSLLPFRMKARRRAYISWVGLRGAVPIVFATYPLLAGIAQAEMIFNLVFFISVTSVLVQGTTLALVARWFNVVQPEEEPVSVKEEVGLWDETPRPIREEITVAPGHAAVGRKIVDLSFPSAVLISLIGRDGKYFTPGGSTVLEAGDELQVLADTRESLEAVRVALDTVPK